MTPRPRPNQAIELKLCVNHGALSPSSLLCSLHILFGPALQAGCPAVAMQQASLLYSVQRAAAAAAALGGCSVGGWLVLPTLLPSVHLPPPPHPLSLLLLFSWNLRIKSTALSPKRLEGEFPPWILGRGLVRLSVAGPDKGHYCFQYREDLVGVWCPSPPEPQLYQKEGTVLVIYVSLGQGR